MKLPPTTPMSIKTLPEHPESSSNGYKPMALCSLYASANLSSLIDDRVRDYERTDRDTTAGNTRT